MNKKLLSPEVQKFIKDHQHDDPFLLSLNTNKDVDFPLADAIEQIQSRQKGRIKLPSWYASEKIIWPQPISVEQSSSETTARFKAGLIHGKSIADLTGGMGVDVSFFSEKFSEVHYVEVVKDLADLTFYNFNVLDKQNIKIHNKSAESFLEDCRKNFDYVYLDPSRRDNTRKVFKIEDCSPNLYEVITKCLTITNQVLVKLSPMVDLSLLKKDFQPSDIWVVAIKGEVKEVLCLIKNEKYVPKIHAVDLLSDGQKVFDFNWEEEQNAKSEYSFPLKYIYEPNASILKTGSFKLVGERYKLKKLHQHTHLYTSDEFKVDFPGKVLHYHGQLKQNKKEISKSFLNKQVNVVIRNFPLSAPQLKKKYRLKDGGNSYLIGTTLMDGKKVILSCERIN